VVSGRKKTVDSSFHKKCRVQKRERFAVVEYHTEMVQENWMKVVVEEMDTCWITVCTDLFVIQ